MTLGLKIHVCLEIEELEQLWQDADLSYNKDSASAQTKHGTPDRHSHHLATDSLMTTV